MSASNEQVGGSHYKDMGDYQPWDVLRHWLTPEEYRGYQKGVAIAYLARERAKGGDQDIAKATHHLRKLLEVLDEQTTGPIKAKPPAHWEPWDGSRHLPPIAEMGREVDVRYRNGVLARGPVWGFEWRHSGSDGDVMEYRAS